MPALLNLLCWLSNSGHEVLFIASKITTFHILGCQVEMGVFSVYLDLMTLDSSNYSLIIFFSGSTFYLLLYGALLLKIFFFFFLTSNRQILLEASLNTQRIYKKKHLTEKKKKKKKTAPLHPKTPR
jgi:hypothetical protein